MFDMKTTCIPLNAKMHYSFSDEEQMADFIRNGSGVLLENDFNSLYISSKYCGLRADLLNGDLVYDVSMVFNNFVG